MNCPHCQFANPPGMKFCGECGARLQRLCGRCGSESPAGFKFCGACGAPLGSADLPAAAAEPLAAQAPGSPAPLAPVTALNAGSAVAAVVPALPGTETAAGAAPPAAAAVAAPQPVPPQAPAPNRVLPQAAAAPSPYTPPHLAAEVLQSRTTVEGERKQVTVMFCDLVSSTALADRVGPEAMHGLLRRFFELALGEVHRYGGTINQFLGDGFMALFGAPVAHEDHARRAVLAALAVRRALASDSAAMLRQAGLDGAAGPPHSAEPAGSAVLLAAGALGAAGDVVPEALAVRMGLNTGWVVVGVLGDHLRMDYTAVGDTTNLAARLQQLAAAGAILISAATHSLVGGEAEAELLGPVKVKGKIAPVTAYRLIGLAATAPGAGCPELAQRELTPLVGRDQEIEGLRALAERADEARGQVVGIAGEAGAGKSRLVFELRRRLERDHQVAWFSGRCLSYGQGAPYLPLLNLLRGAWGIAEADPEPVVAARVEAGLAQAGMDGAASLPYLLELLGARRGGEALAELGSQALQDRIFAALRDLLLRAAQRSLVVVEIEDLHWVDPTSEEFLDRLADDVAGARLLLVETYRSGYSPHWLDRSYATQIAVRPLSVHHSRELVSASLRRADVSPELTAAILERAEGNPFFLEELARAVDERATADDGVVPDTVQGVLITRIDRLPPEHKRLLQTASVLGRELQRRLLEEVWDGTQSLDPLLRDLKRWEFLQEVPAADGETLLLFRHALTQEAVYQSLLGSRRQALHAAAGRALEALFADRLEEAYPALAYHFPQAGDAPRAVEYLARSADWWARRYAHPEAVKALEEALRHAERLPAGERDRQTVELVLRLATSLLPLARFPDTLALCLRHAERVERLADPSLGARFHFWLAHTHSYLGDQAQAAASAERAITLAEECGDEVTLAKAHYVLARDGFWSGRFALGVEHALRAVGLLERHGERWWQGQALWVAGFNDYALGRFAMSLAAMAQAQAIGEVLADPRLDTTWSTGYFYASMGEWEAAIRDCRGGLERSRDPLNTTAALGFLGYAYLEQDDLPRAVQALAPAVASLRTAGFRQMLGWFCSFLAEAKARTGRLAEGRLLAREALGISHETEFGYGAGLAERALGRIGRLAGERAEAAAWLHRALDTFTGLEARFEIGRAHLDLAELDPAGAAAGAAEAPDPGGEAERHAVLARDIFRELRVPRYLTRAERLVASLAGAWLEEAAGGAAVPPVPSGPLL
jgi:class 3 adenylate cyclase/tetratricopeptide (TPR) repeat protein